MLLKPRYRMKDRIIYVFDIELLRLHVDSSLIKNLFLVVE